MAKKNPGPAQPPVKSATAKPVSAPVAVAPEPADLEDDLDVEDTDDGEGDIDATEGNGESAAAKKRNWMATQRLAPPKREAVLLANLVNKTSRRREVIENWPGDALVAIRAQVDAAIESLKTASRDLAALPADYRPRVSAASAAAAKELEVDALIRITDKRLAEYDGLLEPEQMRGIRVVDIRGNKIVGMAGDLKVMLARGHVCLDT